MLSVNVAGFLYKSQQYTGSSYLLTNFPGEVPGSPSEQTYSRSQREGDPRKTSSFRILSFGKHLRFKNNNNDWIQTRSPWPLGSYSGELLNKTLARRQEPTKEKIKCGFIKKNTDSHIDRTEATVRWDRGESWATNREETCWLFCCRVSRTHRGAVESPWNELTRVQNGFRNMAQTPGCSRGLYHTYTLFLIQIINLINALTIMNQLRHVIRETIIILEM